MIRSETIATIIRFYPEESDDPFADYNATCTLVWVNSDEVWIKALSGEITRKQIVELVGWLIQHGAKRAFASRAQGKKLPFSEDKGTYQEFVLESVMAKITRRTSRLASPPVE